MIFLNFMIKIIVNFGLDSSVKKEIKNVRGSQRTMRKH